MSGLSRWLMISAPVTPKSPHYRADQALKTGLAQAHFDKDEGACQRCSDNRRNPRRPMKRPQMIGSSNHGQDEYCSK